ncbi:MAG: PilZ domain-containing protein [Pseudomonadota bacterium]
MRKFIRHPSCVPVEISVEDAQESAEHFTLNVSSGGLAFRLLHPVETGARISISMPQVWPDYSAEGRVAWCRDTGQGFEAGVQFPEPNEAFRARMVEQFAQIEEFRRELHEREGRRLTSEEAAREWIVVHAAEFARNFDSL